MKLQQKTIHKNKRKNKRAVRTRKNNKGVNLQLQKNIKSSPETCYNVSSSLCTISITTVVSVDKLFCNFSPIAS